MRFLNEKVCVTTIFCCTMSFNVCSLDHNALWICAYEWASICGFGCFSLLLLIVVFSLSSSISSVLMCSVIICSMHLLIWVKGLLLWQFLPFTTSHHDPQWWTFYFSLLIFTLPLHVCFSLFIHSIISSFSIKCINTRLLVPHILRIR